MHLLIPSRDATRMVLVHDYRYFAGLCLLFRVVLLIAFISTAADYKWPITVPFPVVLVLVFALFHLYKNNCFN